MRLRLHEYYYDQLFEKILVRKDEMSFQQHIYSVLKFVKNFIFINQII
jgi:hypothetical protein